MFPQPLELAGPLVQRAYRVGIGAIEDPPPFAANMDQAHVAQHAEVFRYRWLPQFHGRNDVSHRALLQGQIIQHLASARLGYRIKNVGGCGGTRHKKLYYIPIWEYVKKRVRTYC